jgi:hypothetical protein
MDLNRESPEYSAAVVAWRDAWRPKQVRVLLVAESHVAEIPFATGESLPSSYCRLVYCLGYGESGICKPRPLKNGGTPQYWNIFAEVAGMEAPTRARFAPLENRLRHKLAILRALRDQGIWLVDASTTALYRTGVPGKPADYEQILRTSWTREVWPAVAADPIALTCVIGLGVHKALAGLPGLHNARVITKPQDRKPGRHREQLQALAEKVRRGAL